MTATARANAGGSPTRLAIKVVEASRSGAAAIVSAIFGVSPFFPPSVSK
jgi:hypothetical protein